MASYRGYGARTDPLSQQRSPAFQLQMPEGSAAVPYEILKSSTYILLSSINELFDQ